MLPEFLTAIALLLLTIALADPQYGIKEVSGKRNGIAIEMLFDISSSMDINLYSSESSFDRITAAKKVCHDFLLGNNKDLPGRHNDIVGLITFARYADTACPMTSCLPALASMIDNLEVEERPNEDGTAFGDAMVLACAHLMKLDSIYKEKGQSPIKSKTIILITDGDNNCGRHLPVQAAALAKKWGIKIYAIFLGEKPQSTNHQIPELSASQKQLIKICNQTGGICRMVYDYDSLQAVYAEIDQLEKSKLTVYTDLVYWELFPLFCAISLGCLLLSITLDATLLRRTP